MQSEYDVGVGCHRVAVVTVPHEHAAQRTQRGARSASGARTSACMPAHTRISSPFPKSSSFRNPVCSSCGCVHAYMRTCVHAYMRCVLDGAWRCVVLLGTKWRCVARSGGVWRGVAGRGGVRPLRTPMCLHQPDHNAQPPPPPPHRRRRRHTTTAAAAASLPLPPPPPPPHRRLPPTHCGWEPLTCGVLTTEDELVRASGLRHSV